MSYIKAEDFLPREIIEVIQQYVDGQNIYIPKKTGRRMKWGTRTTIRGEYEMRNIQIYRGYCAGLSKEKLAMKYFLSEKSIQRIVSMMKKANTV